MEGKGGMHVVNDTGKEQENLVVEIKSAGIVWIMCQVKKQMWGENIKGFCLDSCYNKKLLYQCIAMSSSSTSLSPVNNYRVGAF